MHVARFSFLLVPVISIYDSSYDLRSCRGLDLATSSRWSIWTYRPFRPYALGACGRWRPYASGAYGRVGPFVLMLWEHPVVDVLALWEHTVVGVLMLWRC